MALRINASCHFKNITVVVVINFWHVLIILNLHISASDHEVDLCPMAKPAKSRAKSPVVDVTSLRSAERASSGSR